jgi:putative ABC transport system permease protein
VVISQQAAHALFGDESAVGKKLVFASSMLVPRQSSGALAMQFGALRQEFEVIGVIDISSADAMPSNLRPEHFMIPFARRTSGDEDSGLRAGRAVFVSSSLSEFTMVVKKNAVDSVKQAIEDTLASKYGSRLSLVFAEPYIPSASSGNTEFGLFLGGFALVGMIVSSIGILSIMMVSVVERTREIGMRREIGASRGEVVTEILMEAGLLAAAGACVGLILAMLGASPLAELAVGGNAVNSSDGIARLGLQPAVVSLLVSVAIGLLAGLYPALQAARRAPVDALRELTS